MVFEHFLISSGKTRLSSRRMLALKGTLQNIKNTVAQLQHYTTQAEEQFEMLQKGKKRTAAEQQAEPAEVENQPEPPRQRRRAEATATTAGTLRLHSFLYFNRVLNNLVSQIKLDNFLNLLSTASSAKHEDNVFGSVCLSVRPLKPFDL